VKEGDKIRYCTKPKKKSPKKKSPKKKTPKKEGYACNSVYDDYTSEYVASSCDKQRGGEFGNLNECLKSGCEGMREVYERPDMGDEDACRTRWCAKVGMPWKNCYRKSAIRVHPDKHPGEEEEYTKLFSELNDCNKNSKYW